MPLVEADVTRLERVTGWPAVRFSVPDGAGGRRLANATATAACVFLETASAAVDAPGRCRVHADRPQGCRLYPLVLDEAEQDAAFLDDHCPHAGEFHPPPAGAIEALLALDETLRAERTPAP